MNGSQRLLAIAIAGVMLIGGFAFGRMGETPSTNAEEGKQALNTAAPAQAASDSQSFYLSDYKTGYTDGFSAVKNGQTAGAINTTRGGYNDGYKQGFADSYQATANQQVAGPAPVSNRLAQQEVVYRPAPVQARRRGPSKLKTALTIAAPAAIGAGIGVAAGGKKGAAVGALVGGGGGALYHLIKNRNRD